MKKYRFLVADDEPQLRDLLEKFFLALGYEVETAENGEEALEKFRKRPFDGVISDLVMPRLDGLALLKEVREIHPGTLFFLITGYGTVENAVQGMKEGANDFIAKPFQLDDLKIRVERAILSQNLQKSVKRMTGLFWGVIISIPLWLILGILLGIVWRAK